MINIIKSMTDTECKSWMRYAANKLLLQQYWIQTYPDLAVPTNIGEILYNIKYKVSPVCENNNHKKFKQFPKGYYNSCSKSSSSDCICLHNMRVDRTNHKLYDKVASKLKAKQTMLDRYGVDNAFKMADHQDKTKAAFMLKYGQPTAKGIQEIQDKIKNTSLRLYGVEHYRKSQEYTDKTAITNLALYGVEHAILAPAVVEKRKQAMISRFGVDNFFKSPDHQTAILANKMQQATYDTTGRRFLSADAYAILQDPALFKSYITGVSFEAAAVVLKTSATTIISYIKKYNFLEFASPGTGSVAQYEIENWRSIIPPKEIDIYLPDYNLGIEYNGIYHHTEVSGTRGEHYHRNKYTACKANGIALIQICSTTYKKYPQLVKNIILSKLGKTDRLFARKCLVQEVSFNDTMSFLETNHLQNSSTTGKYRLGLYYNDELVQVMTFGKMRKSLGASHEDGKFELIRMATKQGLTVVGGTSRLFSHFCRLHDPIGIISYCDLRYFTGESLIVLGFKKISDGKAGYWYTDYKRVYHRFNFTKAKLVKQGHDAKLTEWTIMQSLGYDRLWDCGQAKWEWNK
jgi:hypothetical protein